MEAARAVPILVLVARSGLPGAAPVVAGGWAAPPAGIVAVVDVGRGPLGVAVDEARGLAYVANHGDASVTVLDTSTLQVAATVPVAPTPAGLAVHPVTGRVYVTHGSVPQVTVLDPGGAVVAELPMPSGGGVPAIHAGLQRLFVPHGGTGRVSVLDTVTHTAIADVDVGVAGPWRAAAHPASDAVVGGSFCGRAVLSATLLVALPPTLAQACSLGLAMAPSGLAHADGGTLVDTLSGTELSHVPTGDLPDLGVAINPRTGRGYVTGTNSFHGWLGMPTHVWVVDWALGVGLADVTTGGEETYDIALDARALRVFVPHARDGTLAVLDMCAYEPDLGPACDLPR